MSWRGSSVVVDGGWVRCGDSTLPLPAPQPWTHMHPAAPHLWSFLCETLFQIPRAAIPGPRARHGEDSKRIDPRRLALCHPSMNRRWSVGELPVTFEGSLHGAAAGLRARHLGLHGCGAAGSVGEVIPPGFCMGGVLANSCRSCPTQIRGCSSSSCPSCCSYRRIPCTCRVTRSVEGRRRPGQQLVRCGASPLSGFVRAPHCGHLKEGRGEQEHGIQKEISEPMQPPPRAPWGCEIVNLPGCQGAGGGEEEEEGRKEQQSCPREHSKLWGSCSRGYHMGNGTGSGRRRENERRRRWEEEAGRRDETRSWDESTRQTSRGTLAKDFRLQRSRGTRGRRASTALSRRQGGAAGGGRKEKGGRREHGRVIPLRSRAYLWRVGAKREEIVRDWRKGRFQKC